MKVKRVGLNTSINEDLYSKIKILALKISAKREKKVNANELLEEGMEYIIEKYKDELKD